MNKVYPEISRVRDQSLFSWGFHWVPWAHQTLLNLSLFHHPSCPAQPRLHIYRKWSMRVCIRVEFPLTQLSYSPNRINGKEHSHLLTQALNPQLQRCIELSLGGNYTFPRCLVCFCCCCFIFGGRLWLLTNKPHEMSSDTYKINVILS